MKRQVTAIILLINAISCQTFDNGQFLDKFSNENFDPFKSTSFFIRGSDNSSGRILFAYDEQISPDLNNGAYVITIDPKTKIVKKTSCDLMKDSTIVNKEKLQALAKKFLDYPIGYLSVDLNGNVFISLKPNSAPDLIRFSNLQYKTNKYADWKNIKDYWYEKDQ